MIKHTLKYKDGTCLFYNPDTHTYVVNNKIVPSVTGICGNGVPKPELIKWKVYTPLSEFHKLIKGQLETNIPLDGVSLLRMKKVASEKTDEIMKDAGLIGTVVHSLIESFLKGEPIIEPTDPKVINCWQLFLNWWKESKYEVVELEKKIYSKKWNYAGTFDVIVKDDKENLVLIDFKTSNHLSFDYNLQVNAYKVAYEEETGLKIRKAMLVRLPKNESNLEIKFVPLTKDLFKSFIGAKFIWQEMKRFKNGA